MTTALERALAEIANLGEAYQAKLDREAADPIVAWLDEHIAIFALPTPCDGYAGVIEAFSQLASGRHWMVERAKSLLIARKMQLQGVSAKAWIAKAAKQRRTEKAYRDAERRVEYSRLILSSLDTAGQSYQMEEVA